MVDALAHRGPDGRGVRVDGPVALGNRRLAIIDLAHGEQPIANEDGTVLVIQNGEIYNHEQLRAELEARGHRFATRCDTEVLVHAYEEHGEAFLERLRGMFALAIWDGRARRLLLARDRYGIKPLYWRAGGGGQAPGVARRGRRALLRLRAEGPAPPARLRRRPRLGGAGGVLRVQQH